MTAVTMNVIGELVDSSQFFAPVSSDLVDGLIGQYQHARKNIETVAGFMSGQGAHDVIRYFHDGNRNGKDSIYGIERMFTLNGAIKALNADYWQRALNMTDVLDCMPQKRRDEWFEQIREMKTPEFEEDTVRATLGELLMSRSKFFAERVDGLFRALSGTHVTNAPEAFGKRMILANVIQSYGSLNHSKSGYINDLRAVVAKFMGRDAPHYSATDSVLHAATRNPGQWMSIDGGAMRIRVYNGVGTAHLEVHPDMAWRLNCILASLYPTAIPPKFRQKPARKPKDFVMMGRPLPFQVISLLSCLKEAFELVDNGFRNSGRRYLKNTLSFGYGADESKPAREEAERVLTMIGGVKVSAGPKGTYTYYQFDYDPAAVIDEIVCSGCIPDQKSHQFYPTPANLAAKVIELASVNSEPGMHWLEPSAGTGGLADLVPVDAKLQCYEISDLHCKILEAKGYGRVAPRAVKCLDFLELAAEYRGGGYHRIVMNPPFSEGRWQSHLKGAAGMLRADGRLVAILPASAKGKDDLLPGMTCEWSQVYSNEFAGTSVSVVILVANK